MVFALALLSNLLLASAALARPSTLADRIARRAGRQSLPNQRINSAETSLSSEASAIQFSSNWAGAVLDSFPAGTFKSVTGTFTVPTPTGKNGAASAWVGIDGDTCQTAILQTGLDFTISNGKVSFAAWHEFFPAASIDFNNFAIAAGDVITLTVTATSTTKGTVLIENVTTGKSVSQTLTSSSKLCLENAEWIVEDFEEGNSLVAFADFGSVTFSNGVATTSSGTTVTPSGATLLEIQQNNAILTTTSTSGNDVTVSFA